MKAIENNKETSAASDSTNGKRNAITRHFLRNWLFYLLIIFLAGFSGYQYLSKTQSIIKNKKEMTAFQSDLTQKANTFLSSTQNKQLELMMRTFTWAVRGEMVRNNLDQVDQFFKNLVKSDNISEIHLIDKLGKILISTNKKLEGLNVEEKYRLHALQAETYTALNIEGDNVLFGPVLNLNERAGTVILFYKSDMLEFESRHGQIQ